MPVVRKASGESVSDDAMERATEIYKEVILLGQLKQGDEAVRFIAAALREAE
jgi:hypothetical protein